MALGGFFGQLGQQMGQNALYGQEQQDRQATIDIKQAEAASMRMSALQKKQQMDTQAAIGQMISSDNALKGAAVTDPLQQAQMYDKAAGVAISRGDFSTAKEMSELAHGQRQAAGEQAKAAAAQQHQANENLATAADELAANPTPENLQNLVTATKAAGKNPLDIPPPGTPQFTSWLNQQKKAGMDSKQRAELTEKAQEAQQRSEDRREAMQQRAQDQAENRAMRAQMAAGMAADRAARLEMQKENLDLRRDEFNFRKDQGPKQSVQAQRDTNALSGATTEGARNIKQMTNFGSGSTTSGFGDLTSHTFVDSLAKSATTSLTPDEINAFQTSGAGLALQVARAETLGGGRGANQAQINQIEKQIIPVLGDSKAVGAYKIATAAELLKTRMETQPEPTDPRLQKRWRDTYAYLDSVAKPEDILKVIQNPAERAKINKFNGSFNQLLSSVSAEASRPPESGSTGTPGQPPIPPAPGGTVNKPPLPAGWSVKVHQ